MGISTNARKWHDYYENNLSKVEQMVVDGAFTAVAKIFKDAGLRAANDDRAEELVGRITEYLYESKQ
jgi:hypothetical protein